MKTYEDIKDHLFDGSLCNKDLGKIDLSWSHLQRADFSRTNLSQAYLYGANLQGANLFGANLERTNLHRTILREVCFIETNLNGTCLDPRTNMPHIYDCEIEYVGLKIDGNRILGWRTKHSQHVGSMEYVPREKPYVAPFFSVSTETDCHPGIYLASREWLADFYPGRELVRCWCWRDELVHAGNKWRAKRIWVE